MKTLLQVADAELLAAEAERLSALAAVDTASGTLTVATQELATANSEMAAALIAVSDVRTALAKEKDIVTVKLLTEQLEANLLDSYTYHANLLDKQKAFATAENTLAIARKRLNLATARKDAATVAQAAASANNTTYQSWKDALATVTAPADATALLADAAGDYLTAKTYLDDTLLPNLSTFVDLVLARAADVLADIDDADAASVVAEDAVGTALKLAPASTDDLVAAANIVFQRKCDALRYSALQATTDFATAQTILTAILAQTPPTAAEQTLIAERHTAWETADAGNEPEAPALLDALEVGIPDAVWNALASYAEATRLLTRLEAQDALGDVAAAFDVAEDAVAVLIEQGTTQKAALTAAELNADTSRATKSVLVSERNLRVFAALRGDAA